MKPIRRTLGAEGGPGIRPPPRPFAVEVDVVGPVAQGSAQFHQEQFRLPGGIVQDPAQGRLSQYPSAAEGVAYPLDAATRAAA
jgi:hypothetical protein